MHGCRERERDYVSFTSCWLMTMSTVAIHLDWMCWRAYTRALGREGAPAGSDYRENEMWRRCRLGSIIKVAHNADGLV